MFARVLSKVLGYGIFWSSRSRQQFRFNVFGWIISLRRFIFDSTLIALPKSGGERLVERRISLLGLPVYVRRHQRTKYRVALLVDEFFGGWGTAIGGYGALARKYICKFIPGDEIQIDLLLDIHNGPEMQQKLVDGTMIYRLPSHPAARQKWLAEQAYDLFISIEMTEPSFRIVRNFDTSAPLLFWIQDPRELRMYQSRAQSVNRLRDDDWAYVKEVSVWMQEMIEQNRVSFISQGESLSEIARETYQIPMTVPIEDLANPVEIDLNYKLNVPPKENKVVFLGRLEAQKRAWIACEIAKLMPQYEFYILGATGKGRNEAANARTLEPYRNQDGSSKVKNLHFVGFVDGEQKSDHLKTSKLLLNTSIWEGIPVSWLEALSYGTLIVSAFDRDNIVGRFGSFLGEILGDGTDQASLSKFTAAIEFWMTHDTERNSAGCQAIRFIRERHSVDVFTRKMRGAILGAIR